MTFDNNVPEWKNEGSDPPDTLKEEGFTAGYNPPAAYFNWFFNRIQKSVKEIQEKLSNDLKAMAFKEDIGGEDISETVIETLDTVEDKYPVPAAGESVKRFFGKVKKFIIDFNAIKDTLLTLNMLTSQYENSTSKVPTAALVYALKQSLDMTNSNINQLLVYELLTLATDVAFSSGGGCGTIYSIPSKSGYKIVSCVPGVFGRGSHLANVVFTEGASSFSFKITKTGTSSYTWSIYAKVLYAKI